MKTRASATAAVYPVRLLRCERKTIPLDTSLTSAARCAAEMSACVEYDCAGAVHTSCLILQIVVSPPFIAWANFASFKKCTKKMKT